MHLLAAAALSVTGCDENGSAPAPGGGVQGLEAVWGQQGQLPGQLQKPRCIAIDKNDDLYIVDITARVQVFDRQGKYLRGWQTPASANGRPTGIWVARDGKVLVADTHYYRMLVYTPEGKLLEEKTIGGTHGNGPGEFGFVTHCVQDSKGNYYIAEYGEYDRIQKFSPQGKYLLEWGGHGVEPGKLRRPQKIYVDRQDRLWVTDACNHRIQVFDPEGKLLFLWGEEGSGPGQLSYPYDITFDDKEEFLYVVEYGNHRVQKFTPEGKSVGVFGTRGRGPGEFHNPWGLVRDSQGALHVLDTYNHRVERIRL
jgi:DNA-binding beta-propeller fold protein YncE